jgi:CSLREA domain-containing protein
VNRLIRFVVPFSGLLLAFIFIRTISVVAHAENIPATVNVSWNSRAITAPSPTTPEGAILVTTLDDEMNTDGDCSLREAVTAANNNSVVDACPAGDAVRTDTITFDVAGIITVTSLLEVTAGGPLEIDGGGVITTSGGGTTGVWWVWAGSELTLQHLSVVNGYACVGGGIENNGSLTVIDSSISNNVSVENMFCQGGGIDNYEGTLIVVNSTLSGNSAADNGGAIVNAGGKITVTNSTLSGNSAYWGGAIWNAGFTLTITNSTLSGNSAISGGGIYNNYTLTAINTIVANSISGGNCYGSIIDGGHNISSDATCGFDLANGSLPNTDPLLDSLQNNGGPTWTHALLWGSPAIDAGDDAQCPTTDQRGVSRPLDGDGDGVAICDIGSFEAAISPSLVIVTGHGEGFVGESYLFTATVEPVSTTLPLTYTWQADSQLPIIHTGELTDTVSFTWEMPGTQIITVTVSNLGGSVVDSHAITITDQPIEGLTADNDSPTLLGEATTFTATTISGTNVIYTWDFGDESGGSGRIITHTYSSIGKYTATVIAKNSTTTLTDTTKVTIIPRIYLPLVIKSS